MANTDPEARTEDSIVERCTNPVIPVQFKAPGIGEFAVAAGGVETTPAEVEVVELRARLAELRISLGRLAADEMIPGMLSPQGLEETLRHEPDLRKELAEKDFGVIWIDARGTKALNDASMAHGNELLKLIAERYLEFSLRSG